LPNDGACISAALPNDDTCISAALPNDDTCIHFILCVLSPRKQPRRG
jgi:hypothetical protein